MGNIERLPRQGKNTRTFEEWAKSIVTAWNKSVEGILETGRLLIEAKEGPEKLPHGEFQKLFTERLPTHIIGPVPFGIRTAQMLMSIAKHPVISNTKYISCLPRSWGILHELTQFPAEELERLLEDGRINSESRIKDIRAVRIRGFETFPQALKTLISFMRRMSPQDLAEHIHLSEHFWFADQERDKDALDLLKLPSYLAEFFEASRLEQRLHPGKFPRRSKHGTKVWNPFVTERVD